MELDATVIQVRGSASYKIRINPPFSAQENACTKSGIWQLYIRLMSLSLGVFEYGLSVFVFSLKFSIYVIFTFF